MHTCQPGILPSRRSWSALAAAVLGPFAVYALTASADVLLEDDGLFILAGAHLGVAHPPGYPLHTLLVYLFTQLPFGTPAFLAHLSSAAAGALACGGVHLCARLFGCARLPALAAAWLFGLSEHFWSQAITTEVYALNALFFFALYALLLRGARQPQLPWIWPAAALVFGLSLANHWPLMLLAAPGLALTVLPVRRLLLPRLPLLAGLSLLAAALPYLHMVRRSRQDPPVSFAGAIDSWSDFLFYVGRKGYAAVDVSATAGWSDRLAFLQWFGNEMLWQLTLPGFALALCGVWALGRQGRRWEAASSLVVFAAQSAGLIALLAFDYNPVRVAIFRCYSLVCYGLAAVYLAAGLQFCLSRLARPRLRCAAAAAAGAGLVFWSASSHWPVNDRSGDDFAARYAQAVFDQLPQDAALFVRNEVEIGPLGYYRLVENRRPDVTLFTGEALVFGNRLYPPSTPDAEKRAAIRCFVTAAGRPVFFTNHAAEAWFPAGFGERRHGLVREVLRDGPPEVLELTWHEGWGRYFEELVDGRHADRGVRITQKKLLLEQGGYLGSIALSDDPELLARTRRARELAERDFFSLLGMAEVLAAWYTPERGARAEAWLARTRHFRDDAIADAMRGRVRRLQGLLQRQRQAHENAEAGGAGAP